METRRQLCRRLRALTVFSAVAEDPVFAAFRAFLADTIAPSACAPDLCAAFCRALYCCGHTDNWSEYLTQLVLSVDNPCNYFASRGEELPPYLEEAARYDLAALSDAASMTPVEALNDVDPDGIHLPKWHAEPTDLENIWFERFRNVRRFGFGMFARYTMFHMELSDKSEKGYILEPAVSPDAVALPDLVGYELQRRQVIENTRALLRGCRASNILLYGSAGTGKSATVKAVTNAFAKDGLRLVELSKNELHLLPKLLEELGSNPLKFILFIDDLSFQENDDNFSALKAVLEGSISERSHNTVIYATSNRRHIVRETFSQRAGDEIHRNDTMQETISLSERFGIRVLFDKPNKDLYLRIVSGLAEQYGLSVDPGELALEAERFALRGSGRSARAARQFVEQMVCRSGESKEGVISEC